MFTVQPFPVNPLSENCYVVSDETREAVIIDCGALFSEERAAIVEYISHEQLKPVAHLLTHGHFDHLWGAAYLHDLYGLAARCPQGDRALFDRRVGKLKDRRTRPGPAESVKLWGASEREAGEPAA